MLDDATMFLRHAREESGHIFERDDRNVECIAEPDEARRFQRGVTVEHPRQHRWLVRDNTDRMRTEVCKSANDIRGEIALHFVELAVVHDALDDIVHVIRLVWIVRNDLEKGFVPTITGIAAGAARGRIEV